MAALPPGRYEPDLILMSDGAPVLSDQPEMLRDEANPKPPPIEPGDPGDAPSDSPVPV